MPLFPLYPKIGVHQTQQKLLANVSRSVGDFFDDLRENDGSQEVIMMIFSEFGRRIKDNGNGTDHGSGGGTMLIGDRVKGGFYDPYPSLAPEDQLDGDDKSLNSDKLMKRFRYYS